MSLATDKHEAMLIAQDAYQSLGTSLLAVEAWRDEQLEAFLHALKTVPLRLASPWNCGISYYDADDDLHDEGFEREVRAHMGFAVEHALEQLQEATALLIGANHP